MCGEGNVPTDAANRLHDAPGVRRVQTRRFASCSSASMEIAGQVYGDRAGNQDVGSRRRALDSRSINMGQPPKAAALQGLQSMLYTFWWESVGLFG